MDSSLPKLHLYLDECGQTTDRFMCVGGIVIRRERLDEVRSNFEALKATAGITSEVKWEKLKKFRLDAYKRFVDYFFELQSAGMAHFHLLFCDFEGFDHRRNGGREQTVSKLMYQLALHKAAMRYGLKADLHLFPDSGDHADLLCKYRFHLNTETRQRLASPELTDRGRPIRHIEPTDSSAEPILQLNDVILGAATHRKNYRDREPGASAHKEALGLYVSHKSKHVRFRRSEMSGPFTVWNFKWKELPALSISGTPHARAGLRNREP